MIAIESEETSSQLEPVRNSYVRSYNAPACNYYLKYVAKCMDKQSILYHIYKV